MIPSKLRQGLGDECIAALGPDSEVRVYREEDYMKFLNEHVLNRPMEDKNARKLRAFYTANAHTCAIDKQGRINLPQSLIENAGIQKDTVTAGNADHIGIWSKERYDAEMNPQVIDAGALFESMLKYANGA
jgi:MraZ protein